MNNVARNAKGYARALVNAPAIPGAVNIRADRAPSPEVAANYMTCLLLRHSVRFPAHSDARHLDAVAVVCVAAAMAAEGA